jgi:ArsR family transcriptional regulator
MAKTHETRTPRPQAGAAPARIVPESEQQPDPEAQLLAGAKVITRQDLLARLQRRDPIQLVNVLDPRDYGLGVIKGSMKIPLEQLERRCGELDKSKDVVTYCAETACERSRMAAELLGAKGYAVSAYEGGVKDWKSAGLPLE